MMLINYYDYTDELQKVSFHKAFNSWIESYGGRRRFLREMSSTKDVMALIGFSTFFQIEYEARLPKKGDPNFQSNIWNTDRIVRSILNEAKTHQEESLKSRRKYILLIFLIAGLLSWLSVVLK